MCFVGVVGAKDTFSDLGEVPTTDATKEVPQIGLRRVGGLEGYRCSSRIVRGRVGRRTDVTAGARSDRKSVSERARQATP